VTSERIVRVIDGRRVVTDRATSERMAGIRQKDTAPELAVRRVLVAHGLRFRTHNRDLPGSPDVANRKRKWAVFVHGCYWHRHAGCSKATTPKRNREFWISKFEANVARDARARAELQALGFDVLVVWECEVRSTVCARSIARFAKRVAPK
jgi:DNA mismatch endonuclease (patch repair protein)